VIVIVIVIAIALGAGFWWFRDSSLVAVRQVRVTGVGGPQAARIRSALVAAAHNMTTLDVNMRQLHTAVAPFPDVKRLRVSTQFPHGMRIVVVQQLPVAVIADGGRRIAVAGDGTILHDAVASFPLPVISVRVPPGGPRLTGYQLSEARLLGAAPFQLLGKIGSVSDNPVHGLVAALRNGPSIYFGGSDQLPAKWRAAIAVLASPGSDGAVYLDVTDPSRPAAGAGPANNGSTATTPALGTTSGGTATSGG
jgi:cell division protein FtsQ